MINLYARLGILPTATTEEIQQAIKREERKLSIEDLKKCQDWLLNPEKRAQYTARLYGENPEILMGFMNKIAEQAAEKAIEKYLNEGNHTTKHRNRKRNGHSPNSQSEEWIVGFNNKKLLILILAALGALSIFLTWYSIPIMGGIKGTKIEVAWYSFAAFSGILITMLVSKSSPFEMRGKLSMAILSTMSIGANILVRQYMMNKVEETANEASKFSNLAGSFATQLITTEFGFYLNIGAGIGILLVLFIIKDN